jgi:DNA-binding LacI/PurR family transcriptional regulator
MLPLIEKQRVTLKDISERLNISQNTISLVLRGRPGISEATRNAVFQAAEEMGYIFRKKRGNKTSICIITPYAGGSFYYFSRCQIEIANCLRSSGCTVFTINSTAMEDIETLRTMCVSRIIKGIVINGDIGRSLIMRLLTFGVPIVYTGFYIPDLELDCILGDDVTGIMLAIEELKKRQYRRFGFLGDIDDAGFFLRFMTLEATLYREGLTLLAGASLTQYSQDALCDPEHLASLLKSFKEMPEVFICGNDKIAMTAIHVLNRLGLNVPGDVGILGFDNTDLARISIPTLATIDNFPALQAEIVSRRIAERIDDPAMPALRILTRVEFIPGNSIRGL